MSCFPTYNISITCRITYSQPLRPNQSNIPLRSPPSPILYDDTVKGCNDETLYFFSFCNLIYISEAATFDPFSTTNVPVRTSAVAFDPFSSTSNSVQFDPFSPVSSSGASAQSEPTMSLPAPPPTQRADKSNSQDLLDMDFLSMVSNSHTQPR